MLTFLSRSAASILLLSVSIPMKPYWCAIARLHAGSTLSHLTRDKPNEIVIFFSKTGHRAEVFTTSLCCQCCTPLCETVRLSGHLNEIPIGSCLESFLVCFTCSDQSGGCVQQPASHFEGWSHYPQKWQCQQLSGSSLLPLQRQRERTKTENCGSRFLCTQ